MAKEGFALQANLYPRGFLGAHMEPRIKKTSKETDEAGRILAARNTFKIDIPAKTSDVFPNDAVEANYIEYLSRSPTTARAAFTRKVLITALNAFGTMSFTDWYYEQLKSPTFGEIHSDFVDDLFRFIMTGRRDMDLNTWDALVSHSDNNALVRDPSNIAREFFARSNGRRNGLPDVLQDWLSRPMGFEDLIITLHILFGTF